MAVAGEVKRCGEVGFDASELDCRGPEPLLDAVELARGPLLLAGDEVQRDCTAVDGLHELPALPGELRLLARQVPVFVFRLLSQDGQLGSQPGLHRVAQSGSRRTVDQWSATIFSILDTSSALRVQVVRFW